MTRRVHWPGVRPHRAAQRGLTLIEVLISVVILLVALLGAAALLTRSNQSEMESYQRVQALTLLQDMVARFNANRQAAACYAITGTMTTVGNGTTTTPPTPCATGTAAQQAIATTDLAAWGTELLGSAEQKGSGSSVVTLGAMIGARGCIEVVDSVNQIYRISVAWQGLTQTVSSSLPCGSNAFGSDAYRRAISVQVRIGALTS